MPDDLHSLLAFAPFGFGYGFSDLRLNEKHRTWCNQLSVRHTESTAAWSSLSPDGTENVVPDSGLWSYLSQNNRRIQKEIYVKVWKSSTEEKEVSKPFNWSYHQLDVNCNVFFRCLVTGILVMSQPSM